MAEYIADEGKVKEVGSILKAVLTSFGGELPLNQVDAEYRTVVGNSIPYRALKHGSLASFLQSIPDVLTLENRGGKLVVKVVNDPNISMILAQVQGQDNSKTNKKNKVIQRKWHAGARQLHGTTPGQQYYNTSCYAPIWQPPTTTRNKSSFSYQANPPQAQQRPSVTHQQPRLQTNSSAAQKPAPLMYFPTKAPAKSSTAVQSEVPKSKKQVPEKVPAKETPAKETFKEQLIKAVQELETQQGKLIPVFQTLPVGKQRGFCATVTMGKMKVSSYPDLKSTETEAIEEVSKMALEKLPLVTQKKQLPTTTDYDTSIPRVKKLMKETSPNKRFWWESLQEKYSEVYKEKLPQDWLTITRNMGNVGLVFDNLCADKWTVALMDESQTPDTSKSQTTAPLQEQEPSSSSSPSERKDSDSPSTEDQILLPPLCLPPTPTWDVFITCIEPTNTIQLLLVGEEYSSMYSELTTEMELYYMEEKNQQLIKEPAVGRIYVANHEESWFRVEVLELMDKEVKVKFVDHGDIEVISLSNLYHLQKEFFSLPPQALRCCLAGLEDAPLEAGYHALTETLPMGKTLVARVQRREEPYAVVLFDTSTSEDVNLNEKVFEYVAQHIVEPTLPPVGGLAEVYLTHASSSGTLYVQIETKTYKILDDLLKIAKRRTEEMLGEKVQVDLTKLYLARFSNDEEWYRARPRSTVDPDGKALPCRLHNVPADPELKWTQQACQRLMELASQDTPLLLKVVNEETTNHPASVQLFKRLLPQNELVSINDTLGMDTKLFGSEGDSNNNSVEKEVVVSQFRSQQSSCTSGTSTPSVPLELCRVGPDSFPPCLPSCLSDIPEVGSYFDVFVTYAANPNNFAVQPWKMSRKFYDLFERLQNYYNNPANLKHVEAIEVGQFCVLQHSDGLWYRAKVEVVMDTTVIGVFVDFGDRFFSTLEKVQPLIPDLCTVPCLAIKAKLYGIEAENKDWSPEDACRFRELVENKNLVSMIFSKAMVDDSLFLALLLMDTSDKTVDTYINQILVDEGRAHYVYA